MKLTGGRDIDSDVVSLEPSQGHADISDEDYRHEVPCGGESSTGPITNAGNERRIVFRAIKKQNVVIAAASFQPKKTE